MAEDTIDKAALVAGLEERECKTKNLKIHGWLEKPDRNNSLYYYGSDGVAIKEMIAQNPELGEKLHKDLFYIKAEVVWAIKNEMARTVEDVLSRRTRALLLNARASMEVASEVAKILAKELNKDQAWEQNEIENFTRLAKEYILE
jgi:glycerol-3-phosphate dehydrogenase